MPLTLKGKSKARLEIQWDGELPVDLWMVPSQSQNIPLYRQTILESSRILLELDQLNFFQLPNANEVELLAIVKGKDDRNLAVSNILPFKCPHRLWIMGHAGKMNMQHCDDMGSYVSYGFPKLELSDF